MDKRETAEVPATTKEERVQRKADELKAAGKLEKLAKLTGYTNLHELDRVAREAMLMAEED